ncbi:rhodopsin [Penaeus vannamei]|uniref:Rhodopsin n=1 Tax=Penaeus vannamei TaxID=6689 RepID=A0A3R7PEY4_PENVA|nr:rhodopsin [Penaeus vannamei]
MSSWNSPVQDTVLPTTNPYGNYTVVDTVPESMLHMVHSHWYQFPPMNPLWYGLLGFWMTVMGTLSVAGNFVVIWVFMNTKSLRTPANLLVVNLAISDFFMMVTMTPPLLVNAYWGTWVLGAFFCEIYAFFGSFFGCVSIWSMVFITADRYNVIVKGVSAEPLTSGGAMLRIAGTWAFTLAWCLPPFFGWNRYVPEGNMLACGTDYLTETELSRSYLYVYSVWHGPPTSSSTGEACSTSPLSLFSPSGAPSSKANAVYNPIVYAISHPKYRAALEKKLPCLACATEGRDGGSDAGSTTTAETSEKTESA